MGKLLAYTILVLGGVFGIVMIANSQNSSKSLKDVVNNLPPTPPPTVVQPTTAPAQEKVPVPANSQNSLPNTQEIPATKSATIKTSKGNIEAVLFPREAPNSVYNFINKANNGFYTNLAFHRVEDWVIQGGDPHGDGSGGGQMITELNSLPFVKGSLGIARGKDLRISNDSQFFIVKQDAEWLYTQYTNFGIVTKGMEVVEKIEMGDKILDIKVEN